jgi:putative transposase
VTWAIMEKGYSQRRACGLIDIDPRVFRYRSTRGDDVAIRTRLKELASQRGRFGYDALERPRHAFEMSRTGHSLSISGKAN